MTDLTPRQAEVLAFITRYVRTNGISPTIREIGDALKINGTNAVNEHLIALVRKGQLRRVGKATSRGYVPVDDGLPTLLWEAIEEGRRLERLCHHTDADNTKLLTRLLTAYRNPKENP